MLHVSSFNYHIQLQMHDVDVAVTVVFTYRSAVFQNKKTASILVRQGCRLPFGNIKVKWVEPNENRVFRCL